ncbi:MAG: hypothetical protein JWP94_1680 [Mucilaginibacter sp.]|jgi:hypothetical protein|nr:hypothetical protein [Mucilaginibacter sp.]
MGSSKSGYLFLMLEVQKMSLVDCPELGNRTGIKKILILFFQL